MSEILSYSNNTSKSGEEDWIGHAPYSDDDIARIKDPDGGLSENPRTAIPSPLAQLDLVKNAFKQLANERLRGARMNERLVSNALDVAQLFFDYENHKDYLRIIRWNRDECLEQLKANPQHRLYGETLDLFLRSDKVYNFDLLKDWYILMWDRQVLGGTSPASVVMGAPALGTIDAIKVEQGVSLFSEVRHLWVRDEDFVFYMYLLMNAYTTLRLHCGEVYAYMQKNLEPLRANRPDLYRRIATVIPNLDALDEGRASTVLEQLEHNYDLRHHPHHAARQERAAAGTGQRLQRQCGTLPLHRQGVGQRHTGVWRWYSLERPQIARHVDPIPVCHDRRLPDRHARASGQRLCHRHRPFL